ncbi:MAG: SGNH/GDSL hydrolase family protein [Clostridiaceae bacterium]|mgnify:CR=1 FL=1|nr:SGNH/GDSL hydrolase family protein [Clostridiaceae bacterium]
MFDVVRKVQVWGDSVLKGIIYDEKRDRYKRLEEKTAIDKIAELGMDVVNKTKFGMTAPKARELMMKELGKGVDAQLAIIEFGGNDCDFKWREVSEFPEKEHKPNTTLEEFRECITDMVKALRECNIRPVLVNLPPIHSRKYFNWISRGLNRNAIYNWLGDIELIYRHHECYSMAIMSIARSLMCDLIDVRSPFLQIRDYSDYLCEDGIHPNVKGHNLINQIISDYILKVSPARTMISL